MMLYYLILYEIRLMNFFYDIYRKYIIFISIHEIILNNVKYYYLFN